MKRWAAFIALFAALMPAAALSQIQMDTRSHNGSRLVIFSVEADMPENAPGKPAPVDSVRMAIGMQIEARFEQERAMAAAGRVGAQLWQEGRLYQDENIASMARTWDGEQAGGREGSSAAALTVSLETGMEIYIDELFEDPEAAFSHMESIIEAEILDSMSDYMEYSDLLPMPVDSYSVDEWGLTVYYPEDRYRYFSGECGSVTFLWHELADFIGEDSPVYALSRPREVNVSKLRSAMALGTFDELLQVRIGCTIEEAENLCRIGEPDYTTDALVYPLERMRGFAVETPKYADRPEDENRISAVRAGCIGYYGLMTGKTTDAELYAIFGEPNAVRTYDEDEAADAMLVPGESLFFEEMGCILQAHLDESGVLSCLILRAQMPQELM